MNKSKVSIFIFYSMIVFIFATISPTVKAKSQVEVINSNDPVVMYALGGSAGYTNLFTASFDTSYDAFPMALSNRDQYFSSYKFGEFQSGTGIYFIDHVEDTNQYFESASDGSADGSMHFHYKDIVLGGANYVLVGVEDLLITDKNYDADFNDAVFLVSNAHLIPAVPEPSTWACLLIGLGIISAYSRRSLLRKNHWQKMALISSINGSCAGNV